MSIRENVSKNVVIKYGDSIISSQVFWVAAFTVLTALAAQVTVPVQPVPFTLQTMLVLLSGAFLGSRNGAYSQILYLFLGIIGLPVFAQTADGFGFARLFGPTGGYLLAFPLGAYITGLIIEKRNTLFTIIIAMILAQLTILAVGSTYLSIYMNNDLSSSLFAGALIFTIWDAIKIGAASSIYYAVSKKTSKLPS